MAIDLKQMRPDFVRGGEFDRKEDLPGNRVCLKCQKKLTYQKWYCSGVCLSLAKEEGSYGKEIAA